jgi:hypothetical protein
MKMDSKGGKRKEEGELPRPGGGVRTGRRATKGAVGEKRAGT